MSVSACQNLQVMVCNLMRWMQGRTMTALQPAAGLLQSPDGKQTQSIIKEDVQQNFHFLRPFMYTTPASKLQRLPDILSAPSLIAQPEASSLIWEAGPWPNDPAVCPCAHSTFVTTSPCTSRLCDSCSITIKMWSVLRERVQQCPVIGII